MACPFKTAEDAYTDHVMDCEICGTQFPTMCDEGGALLVTMVETFP